MWYLPEEAIDILDPALHLAFGEWNSQDPKRFPSSPKWTSDVRWMSAHQQKQIEAVRAEIEEAREQVVLLTASIEFGEVKLDELMRDAEQSPQRRLLTDNDDSLVEATPDEVTREGFPQMTVPEFVEFFCGSHKGCTPASTVTRIQWRYLDTDTATSKETR